MGLRLLLGWGLSVRFWKGVGVEVLERWKVEKVFFFWIRVYGGVFGSKLEGWIGM